MFSGFDAYSKSIVLEIKTFYNLNEENKEIVKSALRSGNIHLLMDKKVLSEPSLIVLFLWEEKRPEYIKTLLKRIYNEVINENNTK